jgi:dihydrofolate synthase/folylpolyglutamate synthase
VTSSADSDAMPTPGAASPDDPDAARAYQEALTALAQRGRFGIHLGLGRTRALLRELGDPQLGVRGALVAGTNGKGSVLALAGSALRAAGLRAGETPKPHLVSYRERLQIAGRPVDAATFAGLVGDAIAAADRIPRRLGDPTEFELLTAVVFRWFADEGIDLALVEVGLGGRLDATHAWDGGVAAITNVDLDHMDRLGPTIRHIAREKAAIIMRGDLAVTGATGDARAIVGRRAARLGVPLTVVESPPVVAVDRDGLVVELPRLGRTRVGLRGRHQAANVAVADAILDQLRAAGIAAVPDEARRRGYADARWAGRLELLTVDGRDVLLDGAHNPAGAAALAAALDELRPFLGGGRLTLLTASMADKDVPGVVAALGDSTALADARIVATAVEGARAMRAPELAVIWRRSGDAWRASGTARRSVESEPDVAVALERILAGPDGPLVVAGSLYLVGAVRARLVDDPLLLDPVVVPPTPSPTDPGDNRSR